MLGPQQMPPQGARALVAALLRPGKGRSNVSCVLLDPQPGETEIQFMNEGGETAVDLRYVIAGKEGTVTGSVGDLPPAATTTAALEAEAVLDPVECVWICTDDKRRLHVWSYDGRHKRLGKHRPATDEACFRLMYG